MAEAALQEPLLQPAPQHSAPSHHTPHHHHHEQQHWPFTPTISHTLDDASRPFAKPQLSFAAEARQVLGLALPITASSVLGFLAHLITTAQVGHLGSAQLSALTLGRTIFHITGLSLITGLASGVGTLGGQAYGAGHAGLVAVVTQRAMLLNFGLALLVLLGWTQAHGLMVWLGQDPAISQLSARFVQLLTPTLLMDAVMSCLHNHLTCQGIVRPLTVVAAMCTIITPGCNHLFIHVLHMGLDGVAVSQNVVTLVNLLMIAAAVYWIDPDRPQVHEATLIIQTASGASSGNPLPRDSVLACRNNESTDTDLGAAKSQGPGAPRASPGHVAGGDCSIGALTKDAENICHNREAQHRNSTANHGLPSSTDNTGSIAYSSTGRQEEEHTSTPHTSRTLHLHPDPLQPAGLTINSRLDGDRGHGGSGGTHQTSPSFLPTSGGTHQHSPSFLPTSGGTHQHSPSFLPTSGGTHQHSPSFLATSGGTHQHSPSFLATSGRHWSWSWSAVGSAAGVGQYLRVALPSLAMICADWWCFEAMILVAGLQPDAGTLLAVMGILFYTHTLVFFTNEGFSGAAATRCSNLLGAGAAKQARHTTFVCLVLVTATAATCSSTLVAAKTPWAALFSTDPRVLAATVSALPWMALSLLGDGFASVLCGVLEGTGRQALGFGANLVAFWLVGLPLAAWWGRTGGARGMWMAMAVVSGVQAGVLGLAVLNFNWEKEAKRASRNVQHGHSLLVGDKQTAHGDGGVQGRHVEQRHGELQA